MCKCNSKYEGKYRKEASGVMFNQRDDISHEPGEVSQSLLGGQSLQGVDIAGMV